MQRLSGGSGHGGLSGQVGPCRWTCEMIQKEGREWIKESLQGPGKELEFCSDCSRVLLKDVKQEKGII